MVSLGVTVMSMTLRTTFQASPKLPNGGPCVALWFPTNSGRQDVDDMHKPCSVAVECEAVM